MSLLVGGVAVDVVAAFDGAWDAMVWDTRMAAKKQLYSLCDRLSGREENHGKARRFRGIL